jgi:CxxC motif-containing protein (DUF1111 family)
VAEAYQTEIGVTNPLVRRETDETPDYQFNSTPEDTFHPEAPTFIDSLPDIMKFRAFARFLALPTPNARGHRIDCHGTDAVRQIGCALCHTPSLPTGASVIPALSSKTANPYSD